MTLGIDIGGTTISLGLVKESRVVSKVQVPSFPANASQNETLEYLEACISDILVPEVTRIGIGVPSVTDPVKGIVYNAVNIPSWDIVPLKERLERRFHLPVSVNNDANCYALGASLFTGLAEMLVAVTLGTGTGVGIISDGQLLCGSHCGAGEIGSLPYLGQDYESFCSKKFFHAKGVSPRKVADDAAAGDPEALSFYRDFGHHLGEFLSVVLFAYDPNRIVLGGGISHSFPLFRDAMWETLRCRYPYAATMEDLEILALPDSDVALVGAAALNS